MNKPEHNTVSTVDIGKKRKKRKGGMSFYNSKQRKRRELKKKDKMCIERRGTPSHLQNTCAVDKKRSLNQHLNLQPIEEEREDNGLHAPSVVESKHPNSSNQSGSREEIRRNLIITISLSSRLYAQGVLQDLGI